MIARFTGSFTQQEAIPESAIAQAVEVMRSGRLHRYNIEPGETSQTSELETEFARYQGARYCLAVASGGYAMQTALRAFGLQANEAVLTNAFTLSPVPGAIAAAGGQAVLVETGRELVIDLDDLERKAVQSRARLLLLSHMRGHIVDMSDLMAVANRCGFKVIEDCAHTMGARWDNVRSGSHGLAACFSTQTYKHINSGEGGFITSNDEALMARATVLSGSYMLYQRHQAVPGPEAFEDIRLRTPNCSGRMDDLRAAILRPQLERLDENVARWNARYAAVAAALAEVDGIRLPCRPKDEYYVGSSIQLFADGLSELEIRDLIARCLERGVELKWFGDPEPRAYTSRHDSWQYLQAQPLPLTDTVLANLLDMRIPLTFSESDCTLIGNIIGECFAAVRRTGQSSKTTDGAPA